MRSFTALLASALLAAAACDAQVDADHHGQSLATLSGSLTSSRAQPLPDPQVSLVWVQMSKMYWTVGAEKVDAQGLFPKFKLDIYNPPPDDVYDEIDGERYTVGLLAVGTAGTDFTVQTDWYGVDFDRVAIYLPDGTRPGGTLEAMLHGAQPPGFHVYHVKRLTEPERQAVLDCINAMPGTASMQIDWRKVYLECGGDSNDELYPEPADLDTPFDVQIVAEEDILTIVNHLPRW